MRLIQVDGLHEEPRILRTMNIGLFSGLMRCIGTGYNLPFSIKKTSKFLGSIHKLLILPENLNHDISATFCIKIATFRIVSASFKILNLSKLCVILLLIFWKQYCKFAVK